MNTYHDFKSNSLGFSKNKSNSLRSKKNKANSSGFKKIQNEQEGKLFSVHIIFC